MATVVSHNWQGRDVAPSDVAGPFLLGMELTPVNAAPVKIIREYLGKRPDSDEIVLLKVLSSKKGGQSEEVRQGKMLLHTEFTILSMLCGMEGICRHHGLFKDSLRVPSEGIEAAEGGTACGGAATEEVERVILALDCYHPHVHDDSSGERVNLQQYVIKHKRLAEKEAVGLFHEVANIVDQMHTNNIVHRDLKLGNMVLNLRTKKVTIVNFCLSKHLVPSNEKLTDQRGSLAYVSPDILSGMPYCGKASDCWALGVLLYTMLYGQFPFYDSSPHELFRKIKSAQYVLPNDSRVSMGTKLLISRLISLDPNKRLQADAALEETQRIMSKWHSFVSHDELAPVVPDQKKRVGNREEDVRVPSMPRNSISSAASAELTAPMLHFPSVGLNTVVIGNGGRNDETGDDTMVGVESRTQDVTGTSVTAPLIATRERMSLSSSPNDSQTASAPSAMSVVYRRGFHNRRNLRLNLRHSSPPLPPRQLSAPVVYSYTAIGHTPISPPPILGGLTPSSSIFGPSNASNQQQQQSLQYPISPGLSTGPLPYNYIPSPVSGVPDGSGFFRYIPSSSLAVTSSHPHYTTGGNSQVRFTPGGVVYVAGNKRRRDSLDSESDRRIIIEGARGEPLSVRLVSH